jgi:hypothetical protein
VAEFRIPQSPVSYKYNGPPGGFDLVKGLADQLLTIIKNQKSFQGINDLEMTKNYPDGIIIRAKSFFDTDIIWIFVPEHAFRKKEKREEEDFIYKPEQPCSTDVAIGIAPNFMYLDNTWLWAYWASVFTDYPGIRYPDYLPVIGGTIMLLEVIKNDGSGEHVRLPGKCEECYEWHVDGEGGCNSLDPLYRVKTPKLLDCAGSVADVIGLEDFWYSRAIALNQLHREMGDRLDEDTGGLPECPDRDNWDCESIGTPPSDTTYTWFLSSDYMCSCAWEVNTISLKLKSTGEVLHQIQIHNDFSRNPVTHMTVVCLDHPGPGGIWTSARPIQHYCDGSTRFYKAIYGNIGLAHYWECEPIECMEIPGLNPMCSSDGDCLAFWEACTPPDDLGKSSYYCYDRVPYSGTDPGTRMEHCDQTLQGLFYTSDPDKRIIYRYDRRENCKDTMVWCGMTTYSTTTNTSNMAMAAGCCSLPQGEDHVRGALPGWEHYPTSYYY